MTVVQQLLAAQPHLILDGATGTELFRRGLESGDPPEEWNVSRPSEIAEAYRAYVDAGADLFLTNTFGGTRYRLALHKLDERVHELNAAAARIGRQLADEVAAQTGRTILVAGSMGPTGELLEPMGSMSPSACQAAFSEQVEGLVSGGADILWVETMSSLDEAAAAVAGARAVSDLPVCVTFSFDTAGRTMMGVTGQQAAEFGVEHRLAAVGANCGNNLADTEAALIQMGAITQKVAQPLPLISKGNAGIPIWRGTELHYDGTPEVMAAYAARARDAGASLIGACCGSTPEHISLMRRVLDGDAPVPEVEEVPATTTLVARKDSERPRRRRRRS